VGFLSILDAEQSVMAIDRQDMNRRLIKLAESPAIRF
jgi:hypothetical protein